MLRGSSLRLLLVVAVVAAITTTVLHVTAKATSNTANTRSHAAVAVEWIPEVFDGPDFAAIDMLASSEGWLGAESGNIYRFDGSEWLLSSNVGGNGGIFDIEMLSPKSGWAVGMVRDTLASEDRGAIWQFQNGKWLRVPAPFNRPLYGIDMLSESEGWAVGDGGSIVYFNGATWEVTQGGYFGPALYDIMMASPTDGWIVGNGVVLRYDGTTWTEIDDDLYLGGHDVDAFPDGQMWAAWGKVFHFDGAEFAEVLLPSFSAEAIDMISQEEGWAVGGDYGSGEAMGAVWRYSSGQWQREADADTPLTDIYMMSTSEGWAVGQGGTVLYFNGTQWIDRSDYVLPQSAASSRPGYVSDVDLISQSDGWAISDGKLLHFDGVTWSPVTPAANGVQLEWLTTLDMLTSNDGWAFGRDGANDFYPLHYDGNAWSLVHTGAGFDGTVRDLDMQSSNLGWAVGTTPFSSDPAAMRYDGSSWQSVSFPSSMNGSDLWGVSVVAADDVWVVGGRSIHHFNGQEWRDSPVPADARFLRAIEMVSSSMG